MLRFLCFFLIFYCKTVVFSNDYLIKNLKETKLVEVKRLSINGLEIIDPWARSARMGGNSAVYFNIKNVSNKDYILLDVYSEVADKVEIHNSFTDLNGVSRMVPINKIVIPARSTVKLQPGGIHIMLIELKNNLNSVLNDSNVMKEFVISLKIKDLDIQDIIVKVR